METRKVVFTLQDNGKFAPLEGAEAVSFFSAQLENGVCVLEVRLPKAYTGIDHYLEFRKPSGAVLSSDKLTQTVLGDVPVISLTVGNTLVDEAGVYMVDYVGRSGTQIVKSRYQLVFSVSRNLNANEFIVSGDPDFVASMQARVTALENAGDGGWFWFANLAAFPAAGVLDTGYVAKDTGVIYRWNGTIYETMSPALTIGEAAGTAYAGDKGKEAHDKAFELEGKVTTSDDVVAEDGTLVVQEGTSGKKYRKTTNKIADILSHIATAVGHFANYLNPHQVTKVQVGLGNAENTSDANKPVSVAQMAALGLKSNQLLVANMLSHGDFDAMTNWVAGGGTGAVSNNTYSLTGNGSLNIPNISQSLYGIVTGNKYFVRVSVRVTNSLCTQLRVRFFGTSATDISVLNPTINTWYTLSQVITASGSGNGSFVPTAVYASNADANGTVLEVKYAEVFNLTTPFLVGNEPTASQTNAYLASKFANSFVSSTGSIFDLIDLFTLFKEKTLLSIPTSYQLVVGDTFELFYKGIIDSADYKDYFVEAVSTFGFNYKRKFVYTPSAGDVGTKTVTFYLYDKKHNLQDTKAVSLVIKAKATNPVTIKNVLCIGDSLTAGSQYVTELRTRLVTTDGLSNLAFVGTKGTAPNQHEGVSGWKINDFLGASSPFYNSGSGLIDFANYCTVNSISSLDYVYILLGWNTYELYNADKQNYLATYVGLLKTLADYIIAAFPSCKISFVGLEVPSQDGVGHNYGTNSVYRFWDMQKFVHLLNSSLPIAAAYYTGGTFVQLSGQFDTEFNMPSSLYPVNVRNATTEVRGTNGIHPDTTGYLQIADAIYRDLSNKL